MRSRCPAEPVEHGANNSGLATLTFAAAAEELQFGRAAGRLFLSQEALSKRIARMEDEPGERLFSDCNHAVLREAGRRFLDYARQVLVGTAVGAPARPTKSWAPTTSPPASTRVLRLSS